MPYRKISIYTGGFYHIYARGVEKRSLFLDNHDYQRFQHSLYLFNDQRPITVNRRLPQSQEELNIRQQLVSIICYCLMPNHFHLILSQKTDGGIVKFLRKLATGYAMYFNERYQRTGVLFDGRYRAKEIDSDEYMLHLTRYIHLNPLNLIMANWKEGVSDWKKAEEFLKSYRWSSLCDYLGIDNYKSILDWSEISAHISVKCGKPYHKFLVEARPLLKVAVDEGF